MVNLVTAVVEWGIGLVKAIANGSALEYIQETIVKPFVDALMAFVRWVMDILVESMKLLFDPLKEWILRKFSTLANNFKMAIHRMLEDIQMDGDFSSQSRNVLEWALLRSGGSSLFWTFFWILGVVATVFSALAILANVVPMGSGLVWLFQFAALISISAWALGTVASLLGEGIAGLMRRDYSGTPMESIDEFFENALGYGPLEVVREEITAGIITIVVFAIGLSAFGLAASALAWLAFGLALYSLANPSNDDSLLWFTLGVVSLLAVLLSSGSLLSALGWGPFSWGFILVDSIAVILGSISVAVCLAKLY